MTAWKHAERRAAALVGGKRHVRKDHGESAPDVDGGPFTVEVKWRARLPRLLTLAMAQAEKHATAARPPLVIVYEKRKRSGFVVMRTGDFKDWYGALPCPQEAGAPAVEAEAPGVTDRPVPAALAEEQAPPRG
jgi:hypothetical protein